MKGKDILILGGTGLVGSSFVKFYKASSLTAGRKGCNLFLNLTSEEQVKEAIKKSDCRFVVNFAAYTQVDEAEKQKGDVNGEVYIVNTLLPFWISQACFESGKSFYHLSTDYVFDGKSKNRPYTENDLPKPLDSWYSQTKYKGEIKAQKVFGKAGGLGIVRISFPYSGSYERKLDIARVVIAKLKSNEEYFGILDQKIKPTSVEDIAKAIYLLISKKAFGVYHVAGNFDPQGYTTPYDFSLSVAKKHRLDTSLIKPISFAKFSKSRTASRPQHTWLDTSKIESLGMKFRKGYV